jgi:hypothetical protein
MASWFRFAGVLIAATIAATGVRAEERQTGGATVLNDAEPDVVLHALVRAGLEGEIGKDDDGDPKINSTDKAHPFVIHFYDCDDAHSHCPYIQITQGWDLKKGSTVDKMEKWNEDNVWGQAYLDDEKDPWLALTINFNGGVTPEYVDDMIDWWSVIAGDFEKHIGWSRN